MIYLLNYKIENMWYIELLKNKNGFERSKDGLKPLLGFFNNKKEFIEYFVSSVLFFTEDMVKKQAEKFQEEIIKKEKVPVRYTLKSKEHFYYLNKKNQKGISRKTFKNRKDAQVFSEKNDLFHDETKIKVKIDKDGNYYVRRNILDATGYTVSQGVLSDISNYVISHIWGRTENPYFFSSLWNVILVPNHLAFILDKPDDNSEIVRELKEIIKVIATDLFQPNVILDKLEEKLVEENYDLLDEESKNIFDDIKIGEKINFIDKKTESDIAKVIEEVEHIEEEMEKKPKEKNKQFIFRIFKELESAKIDLTEVFTNDELCKELFGMKYPILFDISNISDSQISEKISFSGKERYYSFKKQDNIIVFNDKKYLVTNHWFPENRTALTKWLLGKQIQE